ncbi:ABC transporter permease [Paenibacillus sambharensis]|nr:ABC transporter permease [Paenibacillus sambharensis]
MWHLIRLELKKGRLTGYIWGSLIAYGVIASLLMLIYFVEGIEGADPVFQSYPDMLFLIDVLIRATFIIYASVLLSKLMINEFRDKTIGLLFAYPINRKKLIAAKLLIVFTWTFLNVIIANLLIDALLILVNSQTGYVTGPLTGELLMEHGINVLMQAFGAAGMSLLPLVLGMRKKSVSATIASSIFIVMIVCSHNLGFSLSSIIAIPLSLAALGIFLTYLSFRNIHQMDVG